MSGQTERTTRTAQQRRCSSCKTKRVFSCLLYLLTLLRRNRPLSIEPVFSLSLRKWMTKNSQAFSPRPGRAGKRGGVCTVNLSNSSRSWRSPHVAKSILISTTSSLTITAEQILPPDENGSKEAHEIPTLDGVGAFPNFVLRAEDASLSKFLRPSRTCRVCCVIRGFISTSSFGVDFPPRELSLGRAKPKWSGIHRLPVHGVQPCRCTFMPP